MLVTFSTASFVEGVFKFHFVVGNVYPHQYGSICVAAPPQSQKWTEPKLQSYKNSLFAGLLVYLTELWQNEKSILDGEFIHNIAPMDGFEVFCEGSTFDFENPPSFVTKFLEGRRYLESILLPA